MSRVQNPLPLQNNLYFYLKVLKFDYITVDNNFRLMVLLCSKKTSSQYIIDNKFLLYFLHYYKQQDIRDS